MGIMTAITDHLQKLHFFSQLKGYGAYNIRIMFLIHFWLEDFCCTSCLSLISHLPLYNPLNIKKAKQKKAIKASKLNATSISGSWAWSSDSCGFVKTEERVSVSISHISQIVVGHATSDPLRLPRPPSEIIATNRGGRWRCRPCALQATGMKLGHYWLALGHHLASSLPPQ